MNYKPGYYLAFVLSKESRDELIKLFPPSFDRVICHHVTIAFNLDEGMFDSIVDTFGEHPKVVATGYLVGQNLECFTVEINGSHRLILNGQRFHITHSLQSPAKPVDSNKLITNSKEPNREISAELTGKLEMIKK
jgi:hypothetical protein